MSDYAENMRWGYQKEKECSELLKELYSDIALIQRSDVVDVEVLQAVRREIPSSPNFQIFISGSETPIYGWCEAGRMTYEEFLSYTKGMFVKLKTFRSMQPEHYLIRPLVRRLDDTILDIIAIKQDEMEMIVALQQAHISRRDGKKPIGSGWTAKVNVKSFHTLVRDRNKTANTFLEALLN